MKIAFVMGFFDRVKTALNEFYPEDVYRDRLIWIEAGKGALTKFKGRFYDVVKTADGLLVCLGRPESQRHIEEAVRGIVGTSKAPIELSVFGNIYDAAPVVKLVKAFGLETEPQICSQKIREKIAYGRILCMSLDGKTTVLTALRRAGFSAAAIEECFEEEVRVGARNSNLIRDLQTRAKSHSYLLYAWDGLRTITPEAKKDFKCGCHEARSAAQVVDLFKAWILDGN